ncbi:MAG TPA: protein-glutamine glutaminase family protein [Verrucomicrobiae bacterium]
MPNPNAIVSTILRFEPQLEGAVAETMRAKGGLSIHLEDGRQARVDPASPHFAEYIKILDGLSKLHSPVYFELDPGTSFITRLLIPHVSRVANVRPIEEGALSVELEISQARHVLRKGQMDYDQLAMQLRDAKSSGKPVIVTEDDAHNIIDVRPYLPSPGRPEVLLPPFPRPVPEGEIFLPSWLDELLRKLWCWCGWPWWWFRCRCISKTYAQAVFDAMKATSCDPLTVPVPCIPFLYPDDGCFARAHEMCRLMIERGLSPRKVWIKGSLHVSTANNPQCYVNWGWHVAPTLCVRGRWFFNIETMVIDPSLFNTPVSPATWKGLQGDPGATLSYTSADLYFHVYGDVTDPTYALTIQDLAKYRLRLQLRAIQSGPPPYTYCP